MKSKGLFNICSLLPVQQPLARLWSSWRFLSLDDAHDVQDAEDEIREGGGECSVSKFSTARVSDLENTASLSARLRREKRLTQTKLGRSWVGCFSRSSFYRRLSKMPFRMTFLLASSIQEYRVGEQITVSVKREAQLKSLLNAAQFSSVNASSELPELGGRGLWLAWVLASDWPRRDGSRDSI